MMVIGMFRELTEYGKNIREEMKVTLSEIRKNHREPTVKGRKPRFKSMIWNTRKK